MENSPYLTKPFRVIWTEPDGGTTCRVYFRKFATEEEAEKQMLLMADQSTWEECSLAVIQERGLRSNGKKRVS